MVPDNMSMTEDDDNDGDDDDDDCNTGKERRRFTKSLFGACIVGVGVFFGAKFRLSGFAFKLTAKKGVFTRLRPCGTVNIRDFEVCRRCIMRPGSRSMKRSMPKWRVMHTTGCRWNSWLNV